MGTGTFVVVGASKPSQHSMKITILPKNVECWDGFCCRWHAGPAVIVYLTLVLTECLWRRLRQAPGIGMGDAKALFAFCTLDPMGGIMAFVAALLFLAIVCLITKSRSLPLLPFLVPIFAIIEIVGCTL